MQTVRMTTFLAAKPPTHSCRRVPFSPSRSLTQTRPVLRRAQGNDSLKQAAEVEKKLEKEEKNLKEQLSNMDNMEIDGNFAAKELTEGRERLKKHLEDLDNLKGELKKAVEAEKKV